MRRQAALVIFVVLLLRLPFLNVAAQWDDFNYLDAARYTLTNPAHPSHIEYVFQGERHTMRGHPHPPGMAWILAGVMAVLGPFQEKPYHAVFLVFSLTAALSMLVLARRFVPQQAVQATLLFLAVPASMVSGTSFESDLPLLAFWTLSVALFIEGVERHSGKLLIGSAAAMAAASMVAYSAFLIAPICLVYLWVRRCGWRAAWLTLATPFITIGGYQLYERFTGGSLPAGELMGHFRNYGLQRLEMKIRNAMGLLGHLGLVLSPVAGLALAMHSGWWTWALAGTAASIAAIVDPNPLFWAPVSLGVLLLGWVLGRMKHPGDRFLAAWVLLYFVAALAIFFAGAARYLLPAGAPLALLAARQLSKRAPVLWAAILLNLALGGSMAWVNAQHWNTCRAFARQAMERAQGRRTWIAAEWGLRHYAEELGAKPLLRGMVLEPGDMLITSRLSGNIPYGQGGNTLVERLKFQVRPTLPLRIAGLSDGAGYATIGWGLRALGWTAAPVDELALFEAVREEPSLSMLPMASEAIERQIVSGVYGVEQGSWRWAAQRSVYVLKVPSRRSRLIAGIYIPDDAPGRILRLEMGGKVLAEKQIPKPGSYRIESPVLELDESSITVALTIDKDFQPPGDYRRLGLIVSMVGLNPAR